MSIHLQRFYNGELVNSYLNSFRLAPRSHTFKERPLSSRNKKQYINKINTNIIPARKKKAGNAAHIAELAFVEKVRNYLVREWNKLNKKTQMNKKLKQINNSKVSKKSKQNFARWALAKK
jgi:hypothetical protein